MTLKIVRPQTEAEKNTRTTTDTWEVTPKTVQGWLLPAFQRPLKHTSKLVAISEEIATTGIIPGVLTIGVLSGERYLIDGQHRREAFLLSACPIGYVDVRIAHYKSLAEMAEEFTKLNSRISVMKPDDILRALESSSASLARIRAEAPFVGYDQIRRGANAPVISASAVLRCWWASARETPASGGTTASAALEALDDAEIAALLAFLKIAHSAWGTDAEFHRLWGNLNVTLCAWLYRRLVLTRAAGRTVHLSPAHFQKCLTALTAEDGYLDYLRNRSLSESSRSPTYTRLRAVFVRRLTEELGSKPAFPSPEWVHS